MLSVVGAGLRTVERQRDGLGSGCMHLREALREPLRVPARPDEARHAAGAIVVGAEDDAIDTDTGVKANLQYVIAIQRPGAGDTIIESDSDNAFNDSTGSTGSDCQLVIRSSALRRLKSFGFNGFGMCAAAPISWNARAR